jgi:hypothetical protein
MKRTTTTAGPDTITAALAIAYEAGRLIVRDLLIPLLALCITLATLHRERTLPTLPATTTAAAPLALPPATTEPVQALGHLTVVQLRQLAREAGHKQLARSGRKADLLAALEA